MTGTSFQVPPLCTVYLPSFITVSYGKEIGGLGISIDPECDKVSIYNQSDKRGDISTYQPEVDSWKVVRINVGKHF